jgi:hypothetical protein
VSDTNGAAVEERLIDLDAARAARLEKKGPGPKVKVDGQVYDLPRELPAEAVHAFGGLVSGDPSMLEVGVRSLFGDAWPALKASGLSFDDEVFLLETALALYGFDLPELSASGASSPNIGKLSRPTSPATTPST